MRLARDARLMGTFFERLFSQLHTSRSGFLKGSGRSSTALTKLKMAVFAPMPSASVSTATAVKPGFFSNWRKANFRSFITQRLHRIDLRRAPGRQPAGQQCHGSQEQRDEREGERVPHTDSKEQGAHHSGERKCPNHAHSNTDASQFHALPQDHQNNFVSLRPHCQAYADLARTTGYLLPHYRVESHHRQDDGQDAAKGHQI